MMDSNSLFFQLVQMAVGQRGGLTHAPSDGEWTALLDMAKKHRMVGALYDAAESVVRQFDIRPVPRQLIVWYGTCEKIQERNEQNLEACNRVVSFFREHGMDGILLKGQGLALLYDNPKCRLCGDIDYWVYRCVDNDTHQVSSTINDIIRNVLRLANQISHCDHHVCYHHCDFGRMNNIDVEVHWRPSWMYNPITNYRFQRWAREQLPTFQESMELGVVLPSQGFNRVFILLHIYRHLFFEGIGLRQVMDYYYVLRQKCDGQERVEALATIRRLHMGAFTRALMWVLREVFGAPDEMLLCEPNEKDGRFLLNEIMVSGDFGKSDVRLLRRRNETFVHYAARKIVRNFWLFRFGPMEVICTPIWRLWHYWWMVYHKL